MALNGRDDIAILQLVVFVPCTAIAALLCVRHGFGRVSGWIFMMVLSLVRITGAILHFVSHSRNPGTEKSAIIGALVCNSIGFSLLNLVFVGMLSRVNDSMSTKLPPLFFKGIAAFSLIGVVLGITGGTRGQNYSSGPPTINSLTKVAIVMYFLIFVALLAMLCLLSFKRAQANDGEKRLLLSVATCSPFLLVRYIYSLRYDFTGDENFSSAFGNVTLYLCMNVLEEVLVVLIALGTGLTLSKPPSFTGEENELSATSLGVTGEYRMVGGSDGTRLIKGGETRVTTASRRKPRGPITWLIRSTKDYLAGREQYASDDGARRASGAGTLNRNLRDRQWR